MTENKPISFQFKLCKTEQFAVLNDNYKETEHVGLNTTLQFKTNNEKRGLGAFAKFSFEQSNCPFLIIEVSCHFFIIEDDWNFWIKSKEDGTKSVFIPKNLLAHLGMITVGTTRGVLHAKTEGTVFNKFMIPIVNVVEMIKEDLEIEIPEHHETNLS